MSIQLISKSSIVAGLIMIASTSAFAADGAQLYKDKGCAACHGQDAKTPTVPAYPKIAGQNAEYTAQQMKDIKSGKRNNGQTIVMKGIIAGVSEEEITALSTYLAGLGEEKTEKKVEEKK